MVVPYFSTTFPFFPVNIPPFSVIVIFFFQVCPFCGIDYLLLKDEFGGPDNNIESLISLLSAGLKTIFG